MRNHLKILVFPYVMFLLSMPAQALAKDSASLLDQLLAKTELPETEILLSPRRWRGGGAHSMPLFNKTWDDWRLLDPTCQATGRELLGASGSFEALLHEAHPSFALVPQEQTGGMAASFSSLEGAIRELYAQMRWDLSDEDKRRLAAQSALVPEPVARAAAVLLGSIPEAMRCRSQAFGTRVEGDQLAGTLRDLNAWAVSYTYNDNIRDMLDHLDMAALLKGGQMTARAMDAARGILAGKVFAGEFQFQWSTPLGDIKLAGAGNDTHQTSSCLLIIDTAGDDTYAASEDEGKYVSITFVCDVSGHDTYEASGRGMAYALAGYSYLLDMAGDDTYRAETAAWGAAAGGVGIHIDLAGNDRYFVRKFGQGAATCGVGILNDDQGNDRYECYQLAQGSGKTLGFGALVDRAGNDCYDANDTDIRFPSAQSKQHNASLSQGFAYGRRNHPGAGNSFAGGVGILADGSGDDAYGAGIFAQGSSYWFGLGMLYEGGGNDSYSGQWYVQGTAVHFAAAALADVEGNDRYHAVLSQNIGHAKDSSCAILRDMAGDDHYQSGNAALGEAWFSSVGVLWDDGGHDTFAASGADTIGKGVGGSPCLGIFLHGGGKCTIDAGRAEHAKALFWNAADKDKARSIGWRR